MGSSSNFPAKSLFWNFNDCSATYLRCKEKTVGSSHVMFCLFVDYIHLLQKCYGILPCSMLLLSLAVALNNGQKPTQDTEFFWYYALPKNFGRLLHNLHLHPLLVESWWSEWIVMAALLLLLFMMKVNVWHFNSHKVIRPHVVSLHSLSCYFQSV